MRKIQFNEETISQIRNYIQSGHSMEEAQNHFTLKYDTLRRVMRENNIEPYHKEKRNKSVLTEADIQDRAELVCRLFKYTKIPMKEIVKQSKLECYRVLEILNRTFGVEEVKRRNSKLYRASKLGEKNPYYNKKREDSPQFKGGIVNDGNGYLITYKPDWYTGRTRSEYVFYHHIVMCEHLGITEIPKGFVVHHIDMDPWNNDISNLALMTISAHAKLHSIERNLCKVQRLSNFGVAESLDTQCQTPDND